MLETFLAGIRVLDLGQYLPGPFAARVLADLGCDVVKIEPPGGDPGRHFDAEGRPGRSPFYDLLNAGKRVAFLDLKAPAGTAAFEALIAEADVLLESFRPGVLDRLGLGGDRLAALNPRLVHCALSGYGQTGPYRLHADHDIGYVALTGMLSACHNDLGSVIPYPPMADHAGSSQAVMTIVAALFARERSGRGCFLDISLMESLLFLQPLPLTLPPPPEGGILNGGAACYNVYRAADGRFATLSCVEPKFWASFCRAMGRPEWIARHYEPLPQTALIGALREVFRGQPLSYWDALLTPANCCYQGALDYREVPDHPHIRARGLVRRMADNGAVDVAYPCFVDGEAPRSRPPLVETNAAEILAGWAAPA
jgi:crotonobetainyl-CoA:carnitine CoA-transferase CaiB-like acyl-CoA transferase